MKMCDECKLFEYITDKPRCLIDFPACKHPNGWQGVKAESVGMPLRIDWARQDGAACGPDGKNFVPISKSTPTGDQA